MSTYPRPSSRSVLSGLVISIAFVAGCAKSTNDVPPDRLSVVDPEMAVPPTSPEITVQTYKERQLLITVPPGNHNPKISWQTLVSKEAGMPSKTMSKFAGMSPAEVQADINSRYAEALLTIAKTPNAVAEIRRAGPMYGIDPILILGSIVGEHIYNTKAYIMGQDLIMRMAKGWTEKFEAKGVVLQDLLAQAPFKNCDSFKTSSPAQYWDCVNLVYEKNYRGRPEFGTYSLKYTFFDPIASGLTYGLGQLDPIRALMVTDRVNRVSGFPLISIDNPKGIYDAILNPASSVHFVAANIVLSIEIYRTLAGFDISQNVGVVATLYNLGQERKFASERYKENLKALAAGQPTSIPVESYYGFIINEKEQDLRRFLQTGKP